MIQLAILFGVLSVVTLGVWLVMANRAGTKNPMNIGDGGVAVISAQAGDVAIPVELAVTDMEKIQGLSDRESLPEDSGMLFVWESPVQTGFVMRRMRFPLDIVFIKATQENQGEIIHIAADLPACPAQSSGCATANPNAPFHYVLEVNAGFMQRHGIQVGDAVTVSLPQ
jgi:uncharacterized membrane protein (UPF0127 family)